jgi:hypothetical protein
VRKSASILLVVISLALVSGGFIHLRQNYPDIARENGPMENFQLACLGFGIGLLAWGSHRSSTRGEKILCGGLALFYATLMVSELDFRPYNLPLLNQMTKGLVRNVALGFAWSVALVAFVKNRAAVWSRFLIWVRSGPGLMLLVAGGFWLTSGLIDKSILPPKSLFNEELMEINATLLMLISAFLTASAVVRNAER